MIQVKQERRNFFLCFFQFQFQYDTSEAFATIAARTLLTVFQFQYDTSEAQASKSLILQDFVSIPVWYKWSNDYNVNAEALTKFQFQYDTSEAPTWRFAF